MGYSPLTNREVIEAARQNKAVRCVIRRPDGETAYDEKMTMTVTEVGDGYDIQFSMKGLKPLRITDDNKRFAPQERGYTFNVYPLTAS